MVSPLVWIGAFAVSVFFITQYAISAKIGGVDESSQTRFSRAVNVAVLHLTVISQQVWNTIIALAKLGRGILVGLGLIGGGILWFTLPVASFDPLAWGGLVAAIVSGYKIAAPSGNALVVGGFIVVMFGIGYALRRFAVAGFD